MLRIFLLVLAISNDGLGVGIVYSLRRVSLPVISILGIGLIATAAIAADMFTGDWAAFLLNPLAAKRAGGPLILNRDGN